MRLRKDDKFEYMVLEAEGLEVRYFIRPTESGRSLKRYTVRVDGYGFYEQDGYYRKKGRGGIRNKDEVYDKLRKADGYMVERGYYFG